MNRVLDDFQFVFAGYRAAVVETYDFEDAERRAELGQAFGAAYLARGLPEQVSFWTTPNGGVTRDNGPPFDIAAFRLSVPAGTPSNIAASSPCIMQPGRRRLCNEPHVEHDRFIGDGGRVDGRRHRRSDAGGVRKERAGNDPKDSSQALRIRSAYMRPQRAEATGPSRLACVLRVRCERVAGCFRARAIQPGRHRGVAESLPSRPRSDVCHDISWQAAVIWGPHACS